jgi:hypothetical protein
METGGEKPQSTTSTCQDNGTRYSWYPRELVPQFLGQRLRHADPRQHDTSVPDGTLGMRRGTWRGTECLKRVPKPTPDPADTEALRVLSDLESDRWERTLVLSGLKSDLLPSDRAREAVAGLLARLTADLFALHGPLQRALQEVLNATAGKSFGSLEANQVVTRDVQDLLNCLGLRVVCPKQGCGRPASLRCAAAGNSKTGVFQFDHSAGRKRTTHLGPSKFPKLSLTDAPADRRRAERPS